MRKARGESGDFLVYAYRLLVAIVERLASLGIEEQTAIFFPVRFEVEQVKKRTGQRVE